MSWFKTKKSEPPPKEEPLETPEKVVQRMTEEYLAAQARRPVALTGQNMADKVARDCFRAGGREISPSFTLPFTSVHMEYPAWGLSPSSAKINVTDSSGRTAWVLLSHVTAQAIFPPGCTIVTDNSAFSPPWSENPSQAELPIRQSADSIRAVRSAKLAIVDKRLKFASCNTQFGTFEAESVAECKASPKCGGLDLNCKCGFYAVKNREDCMEGAAWLEVELTGRVLHFERGYRAEKQRVLRVVVPCCSNILCTSQSSNLMAFNHSGGVLTNWAYACDRHTTPLQTVTLQEMADHLGTEVVSEPYQPQGETK